jgi:hypothetical protein
MVDSNSFAATKVSRSFSSAAGLEEIFGEYKPSLPNFN